MAGESSLLSRVSVRFATLADYKAVLAIHGNVFDGFDYLQMTYFDFLRDKNAYNFVAELDGEVVAYKGYIMDGPNEAVGVGSRVIARLQRERVFDKLHHVSLERMKKIHPGLKLLTWGAMDSDWYCNESQMKRKNISVIERWHALFYDCTTKEVADVLDNQQSLSPAYPVVRPNIEQAEQLLTDPENYQRLFKTGYIVAFFNWLPRRLTKENIREVINVHNVVFSMETPKKIAAVSFCAPHRVGSGATFIGVHYYHVNQNSDTLISHMIEHLGHCLKVTPPGSKMGVAIHSQLDVNIEKFKAYFHGRLGVKRSTGIFSYETGIMGGEWLGSSNL